MNYLVDTNILTRLSDPAHAMHQEALDAVTLLIRQGHKLHVVPQNFYEFWVVATRPASVNGLGKTAAEALSDLANLKGLFLWLDESPLVYGVWEGLVTGTPIIGKNAHDARLVAAMTVHGLTHLLTFNGQDFRQYPAIIAVAPRDILTTTTPASGANPP
jgi:predicted nucleic acid-binding protein